jgi:hypothetical protein
VICNHYVLDFASSGGLQGVIGHDHGLLQPTRHKPRAADATAVRHPELEEPATPSILRGSDERKIRSLRHQILL